MVADQDSVRLLAVEGCAALGKLLEPADCVANILPVIVSFSQVKHLQTTFLIIYFCRVFPLYLTLVASSFYHWATKELDI